MTQAFVSERIRRLPPYLFARMDELKQEAIASGIDVIDLGVGDPDVRTPDKIIERLKSAVHGEGAHRYSSYSGLPRLRKTFASWFEKRYGVSLDPDREILPLIGSKEGIGHIFFGVCNPGDETLLPDPGYPVYAAAATLAGAISRFFPLRSDRNYLPEIDEIQKLISPRTKMLWMNYPSNPTTAVATEDVFRSMVELAKDNRLLICHDTAYAELAFDGRKSVSLMQIPGGKETGVEFHSMSKTFCMTGWRVGFAVGNGEAIGALAKVKTNLDSGIFLPIQEAAITAFTDCGEEAEGIRKRFEARRNSFVSGLNEIGWKVPLPPATFYVWAPLPSGYSSMEFSAKLLKEAGIVCTPGVGFGDNGEGFVRMTLTVPEDRLALALERIAALKVEW